MGYLRRPDNPSDVTSERKVQTTEGKGLAVTRDPELLGAGVPTSKEGRERFPN